MRGKNPTTGQAVNWGPHAPRVPHLEGADRDIRKWNNACIRERTMLAQKAEVTTDWPYPGFWPVFINSYSDWLDNEVPQMWRDLLLTTIEDCPALTFQLVTKRIGNAPHMLGKRWRDGAPKNVWPLITVVNQEELDRDGPKLLQLADYRFSAIGLSVEPQIEAIDFDEFLKAAGMLGQTVWGICGGESAQPGHPAREFKLEWAFDMAEQFYGYEQPFFMKQLGTNATHRGRSYELGKGKRDDPAEWPEALRVREFPKAPHYVR